jgi:hypothetical protein
VCYNSKGASVIEIRGGVIEIVHLQTQLKHIDHQHSYSREMIQLRLLIVASLAIVAVLGWCF